jgi:hypothetical protein
MLGGSKAHAIVGGQPTTIQQHPWQVQIINKHGDRFHTCVGIVVSPEYILTARKCISYSNKPQDNSKTGNHNETRFCITPINNTNIEQNYENCYTFDTLIEYPRKMGNYYNDVILLHTSQPLDFNGTSIKAIEYEPNHDVPGIQIQLSGWDTINTANHGNNIPLQMQVINDLHIINPNFVEQPLNPAVYNNLVKDENIVDIQTSGDINSKIVVYDGRPICLVQVGNFRIPFYVSTGGGN